MYYPLSPLEVKALNLSELRNEYEKASIEIGLIAERNADLQTQIELRQDQYSASILEAKQSLRDRIAALAISGILANGDYDPSYADHWAKQSYAIADAMLKARES